MIGPSEVLPEWWGADPTGTHDSTAALVSALTWASQQGARVRLGRGTYRFAQTLKLEGDGVQLVGAGVRQTTLQWEGDDEQAIHVHHTEGPVTLVHDALLQDFKLQGKAHSGGDADPTRFGIKVERATNGLLQRVFVHGFHSDLPHPPTTNPRERTGPLVDGAAASGIGIYLAEVYNWQVTHCATGSCRIGIATTIANACTIGPRNWFGWVRPGEGARAILATRTNALCIRENMLEGTYVNLPGSWAESQIHHCRATQYLDNRHEGTRSEYAVAVTTHPGLWWSDAIRVTGNYVSGRWQDRPKCFLLDRLDAGVVQGNWCATYGDADPYEFTAHQGGTVTGPNGHIRLGDVLDPDADALND